MAKECFSCGNTIKSEQTFCPMCGTKVINSNKASVKNYNTELESLLFTINSSAEVALASKLGAGLIGQKNYANLLKIESAYIETIERFPIEAKVYIAYVDYTIKYIIKINSLKNVFATSQYFIGDIEAIVKRCKNYLLKAKELADDDKLEEILQLECLLSSKIEIIANDDSIKLKQDKIKRIAKWCWIGLGIFFGILFFLWLIVDAMGI